MLEIFIYCCLGYYIIGSLFGFFSHKLLKIDKSERVRWVIINTFIWPLMIVLILYDYYSGKI